MSEFDQVAAQLAETSRHQQRQKFEQDRALLLRVLEIYDQKTIAGLLRKASEHEWTRESLNRWLNGKSSPRALSASEVTMLQRMLPSPPANHPHYAFRFVDLFAGIGGIRSGFEAIGGQCVFTSEWNKHAVRTYKANWYCDEQTHRFNQDIRDITLSGNAEIGEQQAYQHINEMIPDHDVLLAGFPCQPFSLAGVSKKNALGRAHGFECDAQGTLFLM